MGEEDISNIKNLDQPDVKELLNKFKQRREINVVDTAGVVAKLINTLTLDKSAGRPKELGTISGWHLGKVLGIGKGVVSQYLSIWNMPEESKAFLKNHNLSVMEAYEASRIKGKDLVETITLQKEIIFKNSKPTVNGSRYKTDILIHTLNQAEMVVKSVIVSHKIPSEILKVCTTDDLTIRANTQIFNIEKCVEYLSPKLLKLPYYQKEIEFCSLMIQNGQTKFCNLDVTIECLNKQIETISKEIILIEADYKLPYINSLIMMKSNLEKNI